VHWNRFLSIFFDSPVNIIPPSFFLPIYHLEDEQCPLVAAVQRCNLTPSKSTIYEDFIGLPQALQANNTN
jgi:hypothetical protein